MFLAKRQRNAGGPAGAMTGPVTVPGERFGAWLEGERRNVTVYAPGGYHWVPATGEQVLVLKAGERGEEPCAVGARTEAVGLKPGEVLITAGKSSVKLGADGRVEVTGVFTVNGTVVGPLPQREEEDG